MTTPLPSEMTPAGHVVGRVARATGDTTADTDSDPEMTPVVGEGLVVFVNSRVSQVVTSTSPDMLVLHDPVLADLDAGGVLSVAGVQGVELWPGTWRVTPGNKDIFDFPAFTIAVTAAHTAANPLQLWGVAPVDPPPGATVYTLVVPSGQLPGQTLAWDGSQLAWVTPKITPSVTTLAAGSDATATMSGSWPNLTLGLGIPAGQPSTYQIVGAGRPDVTESMIKTVQAQVAAAPVGSIFSSTDGASVGAWQWQKLPAGWTVGFGDTGFRDITGLLSTGWTASTLKISRVGFMVTLITVGLTTGPAATSTIISNPFTNLISPHSVPIVGPTPSGIGSIVLNGSGLTGSVSTTSFSGTGTWRTWGNWPATLIGVAA